MTMFPLVWGNFYEHIRVCQYTICLNRHSTGHLSDDN